MFGHILVESSDVANNHKRDQQELCWFGNADLSERENHVESPLKWTAGEEGRHIQSSYIDLKQTLRSTTFVCCESSKSHTSRLRDMQ